MAKKTPRKALLLSFIKNWSSTTTLHGIGNFASSHNFFILSVRILIFLGLLGYCLYQFSQMFIDYTNLSMNTYMANVASDGVDFPAVTICNLKYYDIKDDQLRKNIDAFYEAELLRHIISLPYNLDTFFDYGYIAYRSLDTSSFYDIGNMLLSCRFLVAECNVADFIETINWQYGKCFTFNSKGDKKLYKEGNKYGLRLELLIGDLSREDYTKKHGKGIIISLERFIYI